MTPLDVTLDALCCALRAGHDHGRMTIAAITAADSHLVHAIHQVLTHFTALAGWKL